MFLASCCRQRACNGFAGVVFGFYCSNYFDRLTSPFHFCDRFSFLHVLVLSFFSFFFFFFPFTSVCSVYFSGCSSLPPN